MSDVVVSPYGTLRFEGQTFRCALGKGGIVRTKIEGDGGTPVGRWPLRRFLYRQDKIPLPEMALPADPIKETDGWCDLPGDPSYNKHVTLPYAGRHEKLWRDDHVYDVIGIMGYNDKLVVDGAGSAIFFHLAHDDYRPTEGCVAVSLEDMLAILPKLRKDSHIIVESD